MRRDNFRVEPPGEIVSIRNGLATGIFQGAVWGRDFTRKAVKVWSSNLVKRQSRCDSTRLKKIVLPHDHAPTVTLMYSLSTQRLPKRGLEEGYCSGYYQRFIINRSMLFLDPQ